MNELNTRPTSAKKFEWYKKNNITNTKNARIQLDNVLSGVRELNPSREVSIVVTKIQEAIMWLGMNLKALGTPDPYPNSRDVTNTIVDKTADGLKL